MGVFTRYSECASARLNAGHREGIGGLLPMGETRHQLLHVAYLHTIRREGMIGQEGEEWMIDQEGCVENIE